MIFNINLLLNTIVHILLTFSKCSCSSSATQIKFTNEIDMVDMSGQVLLTNNRDCQHCVLLPSGIPT
jgi:hypothetical protein